jgi:hypothetical protein
MVSAWAQRVEDEHRILTNLLLCLSRHDAIPGEYLGSELADTTIQLKVAQPRTDGQNVTDVWSTFGRPWKASLEVVVTVPIDLGVEITAPVVTEPTEIHLRVLDADQDGR